MSRLLERYRQTAERRREQERRDRLKPVAPPQPTLCTNGKIHEWVHTGSGYRCERCQRMAAGLRPIPDGKYEFSPNELALYFPLDARVGQGNQRWTLVRDLVRVGRP